MKLWVRIAGFALLAGLAFAFAATNGAETVTVDLWLVRIRGVSLPAVVFGSVLLGMVIVFLVGLRADLRTRRTLRRYRRELERRGETRKEG